MPQIDIQIRNDKKVSILDAGHRLGDAVVRASELGQKAQDAFKVFLEKGDAHPIAKLAPTSLVFGAWDSRDTQAKLPRIVSAVIRAWDVDEVKRSAQYFPPVKYAQAGAFDEEKIEEAEAAAKSAATKNPLAVRGYVEVPAVGTHGGIVARGGIFRDVTVNLVALRQLGGENGEALRAYILGLALVAATEPQDGFLRQGCLLTLDPNAPGAWQEVLRTGTRRPIDLTPDAALAFAQQAAGHFGVGASGEYRFDPKKAQADVSEKPGKKGRKGAAAPEEPAEASA